MTIDFGTTWSRYSPEMRGGDLIVFEGGGFLAEAIKFFTRSQLSHSGMVFPSEAPTAHVQLIESTILKTPKGVKDGPQINDLYERIATFEGGGRVWWLKLSERIRAMVDWAAAWRHALAQLDHDKYDVLELLQYVGRAIPGVDRLPFCYTDNPDASVCSEFVAEILRAGGLPGLSPCEMPPQKLAELAIYERCVQLRGKPAEIRGFNSR